MKSRMFVMVSIVLVMLVVLFDLMIMNMMMFVIVKEFGRFDLYVWLFVLYMIVSMILFLVVGRLLDLFGCKKVFGFGIIVFLIGLMFCGVVNMMI